MNPVSAMVYGKRPNEYRGLKIWETVVNSLQRASSIIFIKYDRAHHISQYTV